MNKVSTNVFFWSLVITCYYFMNSISNTGKVYREAVACKELIYQIAHF